MTTHMDMGSCVTCPSTQLYTLVDSMMHTPQSLCFTGRTEAWGRGREEGEPSHGQRAQDTAVARRAHALSL